MSKDRQVTSLRISDYTAEQVKQLGEWYDGPGSTHIEDWLAEGSYDGSETIESIAKEWDE